MKDRTAFRTRRTARRGLGLLVIAVAALLLVGCTASVAVYDYTESGVRYTEYGVELDGEAMTALESSAGEDGDGNKYTVEDYLYRLFTDYGYALVDARRSDDGGYAVKYRKATDGEPDIFKYGTSPDFQTTSKHDPFIRTYTAVSPHPFNGLREAYEAIPAERSATMLERVKNGLVARNEYGDKTQVFPALETAFTYASGASKDGLLLKYGRAGSERTVSSGTSVPIGGRSVMYEFSRYFDRSETQIALEYKRPVPYGWYVVALAAGGAVFAVTFAVLRTRERAAGFEENKNAACDELGEDPTDVPPPEETEQEEKGEDNAQT